MCERLSHDLLLSFTSAAVKPEGFLCFQDDAAEAGGETGGRGVRAQATPCQSRSAPYDFLGFGLSFALKSSIKLGRSEITAG